MSRTGYASLPLHGGKAPSWLTGRMRKLAKEVSSIIIDKYGSDVFLERLSDSFWFQAFGCVLGYDWHSSGVTTVVTGVLKTALTPEEHGVVVCGGKGKTSRKTPDDIGKVGEKFGFSDDMIERLSYTSRIIAKVDNSAIQAGYQLYHHAFVVSEKGKWAVIQQGMSALNRAARRYHWLSDKTSSFIVEPHKAIVCDYKHPDVLNMTAVDSEGCRKASVDLSKEPTKKLMRIVREVSPPQRRQQTSLEHWIHPIVENSYNIPILNMPRNINWKALSEAYETQPSNYEELISVKGVGPATVRGLAFIAELVYGEKPSWRDPVKYSFAYGGKDGLPYPVNREAMDESIRILKETVQSAKIGDKEKVRALRGLRKYVPADAKNY
jgi:hypothetical protein